MMKINLHPYGFENVLHAASDLLKKAIASSSKHEKDLLMYQVRGMLDATFYMFEVEEEVEEERDEKVN